MRYNRDRSAVKGQRKLTCETLDGEDRIAIKLLFANEELFKNKDRRQGTATEDRVAGDRGKFRREELGAKATNDTASREKLSRRETATYGDDHTARETRTKTADEE